MNDEWWMMSDEWWMINDEWWMMSDEWWMMNDEWWMMSDEWWVMNDEWWVKWTGPWTTGGCAEGLGVFVGLWGVFTGLFGLFPGGLGWPNWLFGFQSNELESNMAIRAQMFWDGHQFQELQSVLIVWRSNSIHGGWSIVLASISSIWIPSWYFGVQSDSMAMSGDGIHGSRSVEVFRHGFHGFHGWWIGAARIFVPDPMAPVFARCLTSALTVTNGNPCNWCNPCSFERRIQCRRFRWWRDRL